MIKITVDFYKDTGKWYDSYTFESPVQIFDSKAIIEEVQEKVRGSRGMSFTFEAHCEETNATNKRLVLSHEI